MSRAILRSPIRFLKTNGYYLEDRHWSSIFFPISRRYSNHVRQFFPEKSKNLTWYCTTLWHARIKSTWSTSQSVFKYPSTASIAHYLYATRFKRYTNFLLFFTKKIGCVSCLIVLIVSVSFYVHRWAQFQSREVHRRTCFLYI